MDMAASTSTLDHVSPNPLLISLSSGFGDPHNALDRSRAPFVPPAMLPAAAT